MRNTSKPLLLIMNFILVACLPITADNPSQKEMPSNDNVNSSIKWIERAHYAETLDDAFRSLAFAVPDLRGCTLLIPRHS